MSKNKRSSVRKAKIRQLEKQKPISNGGRTEEKQKDSFLSRLATQWLHWIVGIINIIVSGIISILAGFNPFPTSIPIITFIQKNVFTSILYCLLIILITIFALAISRKLIMIKRDKSKARRNTPYKQPWIILTTISTASFFLCLTLLIIVLSHPVWCPHSLCPSGGINPSPYGANDGTLDIYLLAIQGTAFEMPGKTNSYSLQNLPDTIGAVRRDKLEPIPYGIVLGIHNLRRVRPILIINKVALIIDKKDSLPHPLDIWYKGLSNPVYLTNIYKVFYNGEAPKEILPARYTTFPGGGITLNSNEADQLNIQINSSELINLSFHIQISYRLADESIVHTLVLPQSFKAVFSDRWNWHEYSIKNGRMVA